MPQTRHAQGRLLTILYEQSQRVKRQKAVLLAEFQTRGRAGQEGKIGAAENFGLRDHEYRSVAICQIVVTNSVINSSSRKKISSNNHFLVVLEISTKTVDNLVENTGTAGSR